MTDEQRRPYAKRVARDLEAKEPGYYRRIGLIGASRKVPKGFATMDHRKHIEASRKGALAKHANERKRKALTDGNASPTIDE